MENGRLFRLVSKLAFVTDRPSSDVGAASGDTGNSYLLQLFRDFVFHQGERDAGRVIDWGHIVENLNKVGVGCWQLFELIVSHFHGVHDRATVRLDAAV